MRFLTRLIAVVFLVFFSSLALASVGKLVLVTGKVEIDRSSQVIQVSTGDEIFKADKIFTRANSSAQIKFSDDTVITLGANTDLKVEEFLQDDVNSQASFSVGRGGFKAITGKIGKLNPERFKLSTPTSTIGIRGTIFSGKIEVEKETFATLRGRIVVTDLATNQAVDLPNGMMLSVIPGVGAQEVEPITPEALEELGEATGADMSADASSAPADEPADEVAGVEDTGAGATAAGNPASSEAEVALVDLGEVIEERTEQGVQEVLGGQPLIVSGWMSLLGSREELPAEPKIASDFDEFNGYIGWGKWQTLIGTAYFMAGVDTNNAENHIQGLIDNGAKTPYIYKGGFLGSYTPNQGGDAVEITNSSLNLIFNFGAPGASGDMVSGSGFITAGNAAHMEFDVIGQSFVSSNFVIGLDGSSNNISGSLNGNFYGDQAQAVGGTFNLSDSVGTASGVFKGTR